MTDMEPHQPFRPRALAHQVTHSFTTCMVPRPSWVHLTSNSPWTKPQRRNPPPLPEAGLAGRAEICGRWIARSWKFPWRRSL